MRLFPHSAPDASRPVLYVVLRTTPSENRKNRPEWYSKARCISSIIAAADRARSAGHDVRVIAAVDVSSGLRMPPAASRLLDRTDGILVVRGGTAAKSWRPVIRAIRFGLRPDPGDLVYFVEDDHLHDADALIGLIHGDADYRLLYALASEHGPIHSRGDGWADVPGGTSSFAVTGRSFRTDFWRHLLMSCGGGAWDELSWRALGSHVTPADRRYVLAPFTRDSKWPNPWGLRPIRHAIFRALCVTVARRRTRSIALRLPIAATHCESAMLAGGHDWSALAQAADPGERDEIVDSSIAYRGATLSRGGDVAVRADATDETTEILVFVESEDEKLRVRAALPRRGPASTRVLCVLVSRSRRDLVALAGTLSTASVSSPTVAQRGVTTSIVRSAIADHEKRLSTRRRAAARRST